MMGMSRRNFLGAAAASAASFPVVGMALADQPALTDSESGTKTVEGGEVDHKEVYGSVERESDTWLGATTEELDALIEAEPAVDCDLTLPDGRVVDRAYVALRNKLNRMADGLANDPLENSFDMIMNLWTPEEAAAEVLCPTMRWFNAFDYVNAAGAAGQEMTVEEAQAILDNLSEKRLIVSNDRAGTKWYWLLAWVDGVWETHLPECDDLAFIEAGINGSDYGTGGNYPVLHVCPVDASVVEGGKIDPLRDWRHIVNSTDSYGILDCICRKCAQTRGDAEMENFKRDHVWKEGESGEQFIKTCMVFGEYADWFIEQGIAERVTKEQMVANFETAIEDGFVPEMYWGQYPCCACLCKSDMCDCLTSYRRVHGETSNFPNVSAYVLNYDADACIGCGLCVERCPMKAVSMGEDGVCVMDAACVACGQCALKCPAGARILTPKDDFVKRMPQEKVDDFRDRARYRMQRGFIRDFVGESLDNNVADNDFAAQLEALRAGK